MTLIKKDEIGTDQSTLGDNMIKEVIVTSLLLFSAHGQAQKTSADYPVEIHINADHFLSDCSGSTMNCIFSLQVMDVSIANKKYQLQTAAQKHGLMPLGDYKARVIPAKRLKDVSLYEFLLPDGSTIEFTLIGQSE